jgi:hypothetical protein
LNKETMQDKNIHINEQSDVFSENMRQKLADFEMPVDAVCWDEIDARLATNKKKKVIPFWWWLSGGAAVAIVALLFVLQPFGEPGNLALKNRSIKTNRVVNQTITRNSDVADVRNAIVGLKAKSILPIQSSGLVAVQLARNSTVAAVMISGTVSPVVRRKVLKSVDRATVGKDTTALVVATAATTVDSTVNTKKRYLPNNLVEKTIDEPIARKKEKDGWLLAASFGPSGATALSGGGSNDYLSFANGEKNLSDVESNYASVMAPTDFSDITYNPALSFGLLVRRNIGKTLSVESGLMYTYLSTSFKQSSFFTTDATLTLHYLGLPVNLIASVWENKKWQLYLSGGGMVEKGLRSVYNQRQIVGGQIITTMAKSNIDGLQWSVSSGIGLTYKIQPKMGLYFEPKLSYFFDNNQPVSTRTDQPTCFGLTAGLRFEL